jgi:hypothetical protein
LPRLRQRAGSYPALPRSRRSKAASGCSEHPRFKSGPSGHCGNRTGSGCSAFIIPGIFSGECEAVHEGRSPLMPFFVKAIVRRGRTIASQRDRCEPGKTKRLIIRSTALELWLHVYGRTWNNRVATETRVNAILQDQSRYHDRLLFHDGRNIVGRLCGHRISSMG